MTNEVDISLGFIEGYASGRQLFGEWGYYTKEYEKPKVMAAVEWILRSPYIPKTTALMIWTAEYIGLSFN